MAARLNRANNSLSIGIGLWSQRIKIRVPGGSCKRLLARLLERADISLLYISLLFFAKEKGASMGFSLLCFVVVDLCPSTTMSTDHNMSSTHVERNIVQLETES